MKAVDLFMTMLADEECEAAAFHNEKTFKPKCLDRDYNEYPDDMELCRPCAARDALIRDGAADRWSERSENVKGGEDGPVSL